ncbi:hypothetical protein ACQP1W_26320 [Spirillospora sp. CA-255316]
MTVQPFNPADPRARGLHRITRLSTRSRARTPRHRILVVAPDMADAVRYAGGWLFDQAMAGWDALVLTADHSDPRPLHILGAHPIDLECALSSPVQESWPPQALAVGADLCASDMRSRKRLTSAPWCRHGKIARPGGDRRKPSAATGRSPDHRWPLTRDPPITVVPDPRR